MEEIVTGARRERVLSSETLKRSTREGLRVTGFAGSERMGWGLSGIVEGGKGVLMGGDEALFVWIGEEACG